MSKCSANYVEERSRHFQAMTDRSSLLEWGIDRFRGSEGLVTSYWWWIQWRRGPAVQEWTDGGGGRWLRPGRAASIRACPDRLYSSSRFSSARSIMEFEELELVRA